MNGFTYAVEVGVKPYEDGKYDGQTSDTFGPWDHAEGAEAYREAVMEVWRASYREHRDTRKAFPYGEPYATVVKVSAKNADDAAGNWIWHDDLEQP